MGLKQNLTILFLNRSCLSLLKPAITSFLKYYPSFKENIVVFDDLSKDSSKEWLHKENINTISWLNYSKEFFTGLKLNDSKRIIRHSFVLKDALSQINTTHVLICHADILFLAPGFIEHYWKYFNAGSKLIAPISYCQSNEKTLSRTKYDRYSLQLPEHNMYFLPKFHSYFTFLELRYFKQYNIDLHDTTTDKLYPFLFYPKKDFKWREIYDFDIQKGTDWYYEINTKGVPYTEIIDQDMYIYHLALYKYHEIEHYFKLDTPLPKDAFKRAKEFKIKINQYLEFNPDKIELFKEYYPLMFNEK